jgi:Uma2 family endonuclease
LRIPASAFEHGGFRTFVKGGDMPEGARATYVDAEVMVFMSPESLESHNKPKTAITVAIERLVTENDLGEVYGDGTLLTHVGARISTEPDCLFVSWATFESGKVTLVPRAGRDDEYIELVGTPDIVVEVVSDSSVRKDLVRLREAYHRAGIPEYWLVDARGEEPAFTVLVHHPDGYGPAAPAGQPQLSAVLACTLRLERSRNRAGRWAYRLRA